VLANSIDALEVATSFAEVRDAALKLPSVSEGTSYGTPCLRVAKT
jgi:hypothetical protein